jgi:polysaccharide transporter, PST family
MIKSITLQVLVSFLNILASLLIVPFLIGLFGVDTYGAYIFNVTIWMFILILSDLAGELVGLGIIKTKQELHDFLQARFGIFVILFSVCLILCLVFSATPFFYLSSGTLLVNFSLIAWPFVALKRETPLMKLTLIIKLALLFVAYCVLKNDLDPYYFLTAQMLIGLILFIFVVKQYWKSSLNYKSIFKEFFLRIGYSSSVYSLFIYKSLPKLLIGIIMGNRDLAIYDVIEKLLLVFKSPIQAFSRKNAVTINSFNIKKSIITILIYVFLVIFIISVSNDLFNYFLSGEVLEIINFIFYKIPIPLIILLLIQCLIVYFQLTYFSKYLKYTRFVFSSILAVFSLICGTFYFYYYNIITLYNFLFVLILSEFIMFIYLFFKSTKSKIKHQ